MLKGSAIVGTILLLLITIFWYICWDNFVPLAYNIFGLMVIQAAFSSESSESKSRKKRTPSE
jgi:hypothetical protein